MVTERGHYYFDAPKVIFKHGDVFFFKHGDGTEIDSIEADFHTSSTTLNWTPFNLTFPDPNYIADSAVIAFGAINTSGGYSHGNSV